MKRQLLVAGAIGIGVLIAAAPNRVIGQTPQNAERCSQIMKMLVGEGAPGEGLGQMRRSDRSWIYQGGEIGKVQDQLRTAENALRANPSDRARQAEVDRLKEEQNRLARLINRFTDQLTEFNCPGAPPKVLDSTGGGGGVAEATPTPTPTPGVPPGGGRGGRGAAAPIDANKWLGDWNHDLGALKLVFNQDPVGTRDLVAGKNSWGPAINCPDGALTFGGDLRFKIINWGQEIDAPVVACAVGGVLEGKFNNTKNLTTQEATSGRVRVGYFKFTMSVVNDKYSFAGTVSRWNQVGQTQFDGFNTFLSGRR